MKTLTKVFYLLSLMCLTTIVFAQTEINEEIIKTQPFSGVQLKGVNLKATLKQDERYGFELKGESIENLNYEVEDGLLLIESKALQENTNLIIYTPSLTFIKVSDVVDLSCDSFSTDSLLIKSGGATKISFKNLTTRRLITDIGGAAQIILSGKSEYHDLKIDGAGDINAKDFYTRITTVDISGAGRATIFAFEKITGKITGAAQLEFIGEPEVNDIKVSGTATFKGKSPKKGAGDTVTVKIGKYEFKILEDKDIVLKDNDNDSITDDKESSKSHHHGESFKAWHGLDLGVTGYLNPDYSVPMPVGFEYLSPDYKNSIRVGINPIEKNFRIFGDYMLLATGLGFDINNYRFKNNTRLIGNQNQITGYIDTLINYEKSKLRLIYINVPILIELNTSEKDHKAFHLAFGPVFGYNIGSKTKLVYSVSGQVNKDKAKGDFNTNPFRYGLTARLGFGGGLMLFATYDLSEMFINGQGPELHPFAIGLSFVDF